MVRFLLQRPVSVTMSVLALVILGAVVAFRLPVSMLPPVDIPEILIRTDYPNYTAVEMERNVTRQLVMQLQTVNQLESTEATSRDGSSQIRLRFEQGARVDYALIDVYQKIDNAMDYFPRDMDYPRVVQARPTDLPVFFVNIFPRAEDSLAAVSSSFLETSNLVRTVIREKFTQLEEVAMVDMSGYSTPRILLVPRGRQLELLGISLEEIGALLNANNNTRGTIKVRQGFYEYDMSFAGGLENLRDIEELTLRHNGRTFPLKELLTVELQARPRTGISMYGDQECISLGIIKRDEARMEDLKESVESRLAELRLQFPELSFEISQDQRALLTDSINNLKQSLYLGIVLALLIMFLFVRDSRTPWLLVVSLPVSLVVSVFFFYLSGLSINIISLSGLLLGVGMMIDNSIIVLDNISQREERGEALVPACIAGTNEIITPLLSSVLTTCSIFVPLVFISGIAGTLFLDQAIAVTVGLFVSYFVSILVLPVYYYLFHRGGTRRNALEKLALFSHIERRYEQWMLWFFRHQAVLYLVCFFFLAAGALAWTQTGRSLLPEVSQHETVLDLDWGEPIPLEENQRRIRDLLQVAESHAHAAISLVGSDLYLLSRDDMRDASQSRLHLSCDSERDLASLVPGLEAYLRTHYPLAAYSFNPPRNMLQEVFGREEAPLLARIRVNADSEEETLARLQTVREQLSAAFPDQTFPPLSLKKKYLITLNENRLAAYGLERASVVEALERALNQSTVFTMNSFSVAYPVVVGQEDEEFLRILRTAVIAPPESGERETARADGPRVFPLADLITLGEGRTLKTVQSDQLGRYQPFPFEISAREKADTEGLILATVGRIPGVRADFSGNITRTATQNREIVIIIGISLLLLYFILAAQFNSATQPFIVLLELPIDIGAGLLLLLLLGHTVNVMALIGIVVMCGIVINDSIIKVDTINRLRKERYGVVHAVLTAGTRRLKPILMTSLTTILSLLPFLVFRGLGNEMQRPLAIALTGGLGVGTFVSLFLIPLVYTFLHRRRL
ncbi:MAG: efflux RND transporter permease subunit [Bacteroidales bacterium]